MQAQRIDWSARKWVFVSAVGAAVLVLLMLVVAGAGSSAVPPRAAREYHQSDLAAKVQVLLDRKAYAAAEGILNVKLLEHPDDAALHVQYARWLILTRRPHAPGYMQTPLYPRDTKYEMYATGVAKEAGNRATQLDPDVKSYFAWAVLSALRDRIDAELEAGSGVIAKPWWDERINFRNGFQMTMLLVGWDALEASPETAALFVKDFRALTEKAIQKGKVASAAMLGNLLGDLEQGGDNGERDFDLACDALHWALANYQPDEEDWLGETVKIVRSIWGQQELKKAGEGKGPESFTRLERELNQRGYSLIKKMAKSQP